MGAVNEERFEPGTRRPLLNNSRCCCFFFFLVFNFFFGLFVCVDFVLEVTIDRLGYDVLTPKTIQFHELGEPAASYR